MTAQPISGNSPLLQVQGLRKYFRVKSGLFGHVDVKAVNGVDFHVQAGETYALVGESGCGKSTTGRTLLRLIEPTSGKAVFDGKDVFSMSKAELRAWRRDVQMVFQDPLSSLDPKRRIAYSVEEPLRIHGIGTAAERRRQVAELLERVGLSAEHMTRFPHEFSGGQRQRIGIAKALILKPRLIICDEPVSALDVSIQSQILNLFMDLQRERGLAYVFIAHDLSVVRHVADRIGVMYLGHIVEEADTDTLFCEPRHPYTQSLLASIPPPHPRLKKKRPVLTGDIPSPMNPPSGCVFRTRCPHAMPQCSQVEPVSRVVAPGHRVACHLVQ